MKRYSLMAGLFLLLTGVGCGSGSGGEGTEIDDPEGKEDADARPAVGTYWNEAGTETRIGDLSFILLKTDKTFTGTLVVQLRCMGQPECQQTPVSGTYKFTKTGTKRFIRLLDEGGTLRARFEYKITAGVLSMRNTTQKNAQWYELTRASGADESWCDTEEDCTLQGLPQPKCPGEWECNTNVDLHSCSYECISIPTCADKKGTCEPVETACSDGIKDTNVEYSCPGGADEICCLPLPKPPVCDQIGTDEEGWYQADGGKICNASCEDASVKCDAIGSKSEGWYTEEGNGCAGGTRIGWAKCGDIPIPAKPPVCDQIGADEEGWYKADGTKVCTASCKDTAAKCDAIGSKSEGWYTEDGSGCNGGSLIGWDNCG